MSQFDKAQEFARVFFEIASPWKTDEATVKALELVFTYGFLASTANSTYGVTPELFAKSVVDARNKDRQ